MSILAKSRLGYYVEAGAVDIVNAFGIDYDPDFYDIENGDLEGLLGEHGEQYDYGGDDCFYVLHHCNHYYVVEHVSSGWVLHSIDDCKDCDEAAVKYIACYYSDDMGVPATLSLWGFEDAAIKYLDLAKESTNESCYIFVRKFYSSGTITTDISGWLRDDDDEIAEFHTYGAAKAWIENEEKGTYYLSHGEMARPEFYICETIR